MVVVGGGKMVVVIVALMVHKIWYDGEIMRVLKRVQVMMMMVVVE